MLGCLSALEGIGGSQLSGLEGLGDWSCKLARSRSGRGRRICQYLSMYVPTFCIGYSLLATPYCCFNVVKVGWFIGHAQFPPSISPGIGCGGSTSLWDCNCCSTLAEKRKEHQIASRAGVGLVGEAGAPRSIRCTNCQKDNQGQSIGNQ